MQIFIKGCKTFTLDVEPTDTVCVLRRLICAKIGLKPGDQSLSYNYKLLGSAPEGKFFNFDDTQTLESYGITDNLPVIHDWILSLERDNITRRAARDVEARSATGGTLHLGMVRTRSPRAGSFPHIAARGTGYYSEYERG